MSLVRFQECGDDNETVGSSFVQLTPPLV
jgi:hypothetical protein